MWRWGTGIDYKGTVGEKNTNQFASTWERNRKEEVMR